jgi:hypothetical protein
MNPRSIVKTAALCVRTCGFLILLLWATIGSLQAQSTGSVVGTVTDASGGSFPSAPVALINAATSERRAAQTDANGNYQFVSLVPGRYRVEIQKDGFKRFTSDVVVQTDGVARVDATMQVGDVTQLVEVTSQADLVQTDSATLGQVVEGRSVDEMPLSGRNVLNLVSLVPGVITQGGAGGSPLNNQAASGNFTNPQGWGNYQIGGGQAGTSAQFIDGVSLNTTFRGSPALVPTQDLIQEFKVSSSAVSPEYGGFSGGVIALTSKSGGNQYHGSAYEYFRNTHLNANSFFNNATNQPVPPVHNHQFGASGGGPIKKDKTFFYASWERFTHRVGLPVLFFVPTPAELAGDFSAPGEKKIYDPLTTCGLSGTPACAPGAATRTPFTGNIIPPSRIDSFESNLVHKVGILAPPNTNQSAGNYTNNSLTGGWSNQYSIRGDHNVSDKQRLFVRYIYWNTWTLSQNLYNNTPNQGQGSKQPTASHDAVVGDTYSFSPTLTADFRLAFHRLWFVLTPSSYGRDNCDIGPAYCALQSIETSTQLPGFDLPGQYRSFSGVGQVISPSTNNELLGYANATKVIGRHSIKFGGNLRHDYFSYIQANEPSGAFTFTNAFTGLNGQASDPNGNGYASFVLGAASSGVFQIYSNTYQTDIWQGYFVNDTFQVNRKLTVTMGLRWELPGVWSVGRDNGTTLLLDAPDPLSKTTGLNLVGQQVLLNSAQFSDRHTLNRNFHLFEPRVGIAYRLNDKTVIRMGAGRSFLPLSISLGTSGSSSPVNVALTTMQNSVNGSGFIPLNYASNPYPNNSVLRPFGHDPAFVNNLIGNTLNGAVYTAKFPEALQWNFTIGRQLPRNSSLEVAYAANKGTHISTGNQALNQLSDQYLSMGADLVTAVPNPFFGKLPSTANNSLTGATIRKGQLLRPFPQYTGVTNASPYTGNSSYNSLQAKYQKRFDQGGTILVSYAWSKLIGNADGLSGFLESQVGSVQDWTNLKAERSLVSFDVPQHLTVSYVYDLPFGKSKHFLGNVTGIADKIVSGWGFSGVTNLQSGYPLQITAQSNNLQSFFGTGTIRPNYVGGCNQVIDGSAQSRLNGWFNINCYTQPGTYNFGNLGRTDPSLRSAGIANWDLSLAKKTSITEQIKLEFRAECFNLANRVQFGNPNTSLNPSTLGTPSNQFGKVTSTLNQPRLFQLAMRLTF